MQTVDCYGPVLEAHPLLLAQETIEVSAEELARASLLKTPQEVLAVFELPSYTYDDSLPGHSLCLALDDVQDPGNLGTIIRIADWFGIEDISVHRVLPTPLTRKPYRLRWEPWHASSCITAI